MNFKKTVGTQPIVDSTNSDSLPRDLYIMTLVVCTALRQKKRKKNGPTQKSPVCHVLYLGTYVQ